MGRTPEERARKATRDINGWAAFIALSAIFLGVAVFLIKNSLVTLFAGSFLATSVFQWGHAQGAWEEYQSIARERDNDPSS